MMAASVQQPSERLRKHVRRRLTQRSIPANHRIIIRLPILVSACSMAGFEEETRRSGFIPAGGLKFHAEAPAMRPNRRERHAQDGLDGAIENNPVHNIAMACYQNARK
jgi:hypothetical protein